MNARRLLGAIVVVAFACGGTARAEERFPVKVMIVSMFAPEGQVWRDHRDLRALVPVPGLRSEDPNVHCGADGVCQLTTGMGYANASASIAAVVYSNRFDLRRTYWLIAGIAGIDPHHGTLGSAAWARYLVDFGLQWELDARDAPEAWPGGYLGIDTTSPAGTPKLRYGTEMVELDDALVRRAFALSHDVVLADDRAARTTRAAFPAAPANGPPSVIACDTLSSDTWFSGKHLSERARVWAGEVTGGRAVPCTSQQEDNATYEALVRATSAGLADARRVADLRTGSDFIEPPPHGNDAANLLDYRAQGGFVPAIDNLYRAGNPLVQEIVDRWPAWKDGVPAR